MTRETLMNDLNDLNGMNDNTEQPSRRRRIFIKNLAGFIVCALIGAFVFTYLAPRVWAATPACNPLVSGKCPDSQFKPIPPGQYGGPLVNPQPPARKPQPVPTHAYLQRGVMRLYVARANLGKIRDATEGAGLVSGGVCQFVPNRAAKYVCSVVVPLYFYAIKKQVDAAIRNGQCLKFSFYSPDYLGIDRVKCQYR